MLSAVLGVLLLLQLLGKPQPPRHAPMCILLSAPVQSRKVSSGSWHNAAPSADQHLVSTLPLSPMSSCVSLLQWGSAAAKAKNPSVPHPAAAAGEKGMLLVAQPQAHAQADDDAVVTVTICPLPSALVFAGSPLNSSTPGQLELAARPGTCLVASMDGDET